MKSILKLAVLLALLIAPSQMQAANIIVPQAFASIQAAIDNASAGDTVIVKSGIYTENIVITKPLSLISNSAVLVAGKKSSPIISVLNARDFAISGFSLKGSEAAGIYLYNADNGRITDNKSTENNSGIVLIASNNNSVKSNTASHNEVYGIYLESSKNNILEMNTTNYNKDKGIFLSYSHDNRLLSNSSNLNDWNGILLWSSNNNKINGNRTLRNTYGIVLSESTGNELVDNTTWPNIYIILPIFLIYIGILSYIVQRNILKYIYRQA